jgi:anhydro-N-acetylmuramic acid kinase
MSGTSLDGIDVAIIDISGSGFRAKINVLTSHSVPYPRSIREALLAISNTNAFTGDISRDSLLQRFRRPLVPGGQRRGHIVW